MALAGRIGTLIESGAVEAAQPVRVRREVVRHPVGDARRCRPDGSGRSEAATPRACPSGWSARRARTAGSRARRRSASPIGISSTWVKPMSLDVVDQLGGMLRHRSGSGCPPPACGATSPGAARRWLIGARSGDEAVAAPPSRRHRPSDSRRYRRPPTRFRARFSIWKAHGIGLVDQPGAVAGLDLELVELPGLDRRGGRSPTPRSRGAAACRGGGRPSR